MVAQGVSFPAALIAGLLSFFSPCVLPMVPVYLGYVTGTRVGAVGDGGRFKTLAHALCFVLGFCLVFVALGATAGLLGSVIYPIMPYVVRIGGAILIIFGLQMTGVLSIRLFNAERRLPLGTGRRGSYWASCLVGLVFAAGWTPCTGPVLSAILLLAAESGTASLGALLLATYSLGLAVPFLVVAGLVEALVPLVNRTGRHLRVVSTVGGILLIAMGALMLADLFRPLLFWLSSLGYRSAL